MLAKGVNKKGNKQGGKVSEESIVKNSNKKDKSVVKVDVSNLADKLGNMSLSEDSDDDIIVNGQKEDSEKQDSDLSGSDRSHGRHYRRHRHRRSHRDRYRRNHRRRSHRDRHRSRTRSRSRSRTRSRSDSRSKSRSRSENRSRSVSGSEGRKKMANNVVVDSKKDVIDGKKDGKRVARGRRSCRDKTDSKIKKSLKEQNDMFNV